MSVSGSLLVFVNCSLSALFFGGCFFFFFLSKFCISFIVM